MSKWGVIFIIALVIFGYWYSQQPEDKQEDLLDEGQSIYDNIKDSLTNNETNINDGDDSNSEEEIVVERVYECVTDEDCNTHIGDCINCYCELGKCYEVI